MSELWRAMVAPVMTAASQVIALSYFLYLVYTNQFKTDELTHFDVKIDRATSL
jgi:hypothetical protein